MSGDELDEPDQGEWDHDPLDYTEEPPMAARGSAGPTGSPGRKPAAGLGARLKQGGAKAGKTAGRLVRNAVGRKVMPAQHVEGTGLFGYLKNLEPLAGAVEDDLLHFQEFARQADDDQPTPQTVKDGTRLILQALAAGTADAKGAWTDAQNLHESDWNRAEDTDPNARKGDVRVTERDGVHI